MSGLNFSLDEYIRRKNMGDQFTLLNHRRRDQNIDETVLNSDLDKYIQDARAESSQRSFSGSLTFINRESPAYSGKFNRKSMRSDDESDKEEDELNKTLVLKDDDIEMTEVSNLTKNDSNVDDLFKFKTVESKLGIRVRSQQWRMLPENLVERPQGVPRLECLPLDEHERYKRGHNGKVNKNYRSHTSSVSSNFGNFRRPQNNNVRAEGKFVEKGKYTFKIGNRGGNEEGIIGIETKKKFNGMGDFSQSERNSQESEASGQQNAQTPQQVTVNMNWDTFFQGMHKAENTRLPPPVRTGEDQLTLAAIRLLDMLKNQRNRNIEKNGNNNDTQPQ